MIKKIIPLICAFVLCFSTCAFASSDFTLDTSGMTLKSISTSSEKITASDATGFKAVMLSLIGDYESQITDYTYSNGSYTSHSIEIEKDWSWILSCVMWIVIVYCTFRMIGGILCK